MITTIIAILTCSKLENIRLEALPSPVLMYSLVLSNTSSNSIKAQLKLCKSILERYALLSDQDKRKALNQWSTAIEASHKKLQTKYKQNNLREVYGDPSSEENMCDLSKIDLLLLAENLTPIFHDGGHLRDLYNSPQAPSKFKVNIFQGDLAPMKMRKYTLGGAGLDFRVCSFCVGYAATSKIVLQGLKAEVPLKLIWKKCNAK